MLSERDKSFLSQIEGEGDIVSVQSLRCFMRKGDLLMALPYARESALKTLSLYQPQRLVAKFYTHLVTFWVYFGLAGLLRSISLEIKESSPLVKLAGQNGLGFLLGNPNGPTRRIICLHRGTAGEWLVTKIGIQQAARQAVANEARALRALPEHLTGAPKLIAHQESPYFSNFSVGLIAGCSPSVSDTASVLDCLVSWQSDSRTPLKELNQWQELCGSVDDESCKKWLDGIAHHKVFSSVVHGDFAPWNIKMDREGKVHVLDWEFCRRGGAAGWDWAHYLIQVGLLVEKASCAEVLENVATWARSQTGRDYLKLAGWRNEIDAWIGSYLLYTHYLLNLDRKELITCWKKNK